MRACPNGTPLTSRNARRQDVDRKTRRVALRPLVVGGDHSTTVPTHALRSTALARPPEATGVASARLNGPHRPRSATRRRGVSHRSDERGRIDAICCGARSHCRIHGGTERRHAAGAAIWTSGGSGCCSAWSRDRRRRSPPRAASQAQGRLLYALSDANPLLRGADVLGRADNWFDLFKLLEVIQTAVGSRENIWKLGWATRGEITRFAMTANHVRHAKKPRPAHALHLDQAQDLMRRVLTRWLDSLPRNGG